MRITRKTQRQVVFKVLNINFDTSTPTGKLMQTMLAAVAEFEREMMLERQAEGIRIANAQGKYKGRKPTAREKCGVVLQLLADGLTKEAVAEKVGTGETTSIGLPENQENLWETPRSPIATGSMNEKTAESMHKGWKPTALCRI